MKEKNKTPSWFRTLRGLSLTGMLLGTLLILIGFAGCAKRVVLHPIESEIVFLKKGETFTALKQGAFLSDYYLQEIANVEIE